MCLFVLVIDQGFVNGPSGLIIVALESYSGWCPLKSPPSTYGLVLSGLNFFGFAVGFGYIDRDAFNMLVVPEENAGTNCFNSVRWVVGYRENCKDLLINKATPPPVY